MINPVALSVAIFIIFLVLAIISVKTIINSAAVLMVPGSLVFYQAYPDTEAKFYACLILLFTASLVVLWNWYYYEQRNRTGAN